MSAALATNIGANDLYNMYGTCNACLMNYNGIEPDAGAVAEIGQMGARGVPSVILKGTFTGDFGGLTNPMPTTAGYILLPNLTDQPHSVFTGAMSGALPFLQKKVERFIEANESGLINTDPLTNGNYNHDVPLPPLQVFWTDLGSRAYFLKHKNKSIATLPNGKTDFINDYTDFWYENVVSSIGITGLVQVAKAMADNLDELMNDPKYKNICHYWT